MRNPLTIAGLVVLVAWAVMALPANASQGAPAASAAQGPSIDALAKQECREERRFERWEFRQDYGGTGDRAFRRCVREQKREARWDCREERMEDPAEYRYEYGTGTAAFQRCMIDELR
jgi:hypothetical protein